MSVSALVSRLLAVRAGAPLIDTLDAALRPATPEQAYAVADDIVQSLTSSLGPVAGFKIGATSAGGQRLLEVAAPFFGRVPSSRILSSGASWLGRVHLATVEAEVGFVLGAALPPRAAEYSREEVLAALKGALPLLEINCPSFLKPFDIGGLCLIADNGVTDSLVAGRPITASVAAGVATETVRLFRNGDQVGAGDASTVLGDPVNALCWLANALRHGTRGLCPADVVASGALTAPIDVRCGDEFNAEYSTLGAVAVRIG